MKHTHWAVPERDAIGNGFDDPMVASARAGARDNDLGYGKAACALGGAVAAGG